MSPLLPWLAVGAEVLMYLTPKPLLLLAMLIVLFVVRSPPPVSPLPVRIKVELAAAPRFCLAAVGLLAPVPPSATPRSTMSVIVPPVI